MNSLYFNYRGTIFYNFILDKLGLYKCYQRENTIKINNTNEVENNHNNNINKIIK